MPTPTLINRAGDATDLQSYVTAPITPVSGAATTIAVISIRSGSNPSAITSVTGTNGWAVTWTQRQTVTPGGNIRLTLFDGVPSSGVAGTLTFDCTETQLSAAWEVVSWADADTAAIQGQTPVSASGSGSVPTATLAAFGQSGNAAYMVIGLNAVSARTITGDTGWTDLGTEVGITPAALMLDGIWQSGDGDLTPSATVSGAAVNWLVIAAEIEAAASGVTRADIRKVPRGIERGVQRGTAY